MNYVPPSEERTSRVRVAPAGIAALVLVVLALIFIFQNTDEGNIQAFFWDVDAPTWVWLLGVFVVGVIVGALLSWYRRRRS